MNFKRAVLIGAVVWVLIFFEVSVLMFGFKLNPSALYYTIHYSFLLVITLLASFFYFKKEKAGAKEGLFLGITMTITGIILDAIITIPLFIKSYTFFLDPYLLAGFLGGVIITTLFGAIKKH